MNVLVVGPTAAGKSTLIRRAYADTHHVLDVWDHIDGHPAPHDYETITTGYRALEHAVQSRPGPVCVEVALDYPGETLPPIAEKLRPAQLVPVWAPNQVCHERNRNRDRTAPAGLVDKHHAEDFGHVVHRLQDELGPAKGVPA